MYSQNRTVATWVPPVSGSSHYTCILQTPVIGDLVGNPQVWVLPMCWALAFVPISLEPIPWVSSPTHSLTVTVLTMMVRTSKPSALCVSGIILNSLHQSTPLILTTTCALASSVMWVPAPSPDTEIQMRVCLGSPFLPYCNWSASITSFIHI